MQYFWINKKTENKNLILFFNGWAMNETPVKHLDHGRFDILEIFDYRNCDFDFSRFDFSKYEKKYLICWSMGVFVCNLFYDVLEKFDKKIAINGTTKIIDDNFGIPEKIYKITAKFLNENSKDKFIANMFDKGKLNPEITITRELKELKDELFAISKIILQKTIKFDKVYVSKDDRIIPSKNQINFWQKRAPIIEINSTHCPFSNFRSWQEILC